jgi:hypothetical protein
LLVLGPFFLALIAMGSLGHRYRLISSVSMVVLVVIMLAEFLRPQLQLRKPLPQSDIRLNISDSPK